MLKPDDIVSFEDKTFTEYNYGKVTHYWKDKWVGPYCQVELPDGNYAIMYESELTKES